jgi:hypothetical protein
MVISLYVCEIPKNVDKNDLEELFKSMEGYIECRIKGANEIRKIAFIDFKEAGQAKFAMDTLQGFKFAPSDKGLIIKISDNTKGGVNQTRFKNKVANSPRRYQNSESLDRQKQKKRRDKEDEDSYRDKSRSRSRKHSEESNHYNNYNPTHVQEQQPNNNLLDLISILNTQNQSTNKPYTLSDPTGNQPVDTNAFSNLLECLQNLQTVQLLSSLTGANPPTIESKPKEIIQQIPSHPHPSSNSFYNNLIKFDDYFTSTMDFKKNATNIVYVEGLPSNVTEREVSHIFRPFVGFKSVRLITREKNGQKSLICFADFDEIIQSTICINTLQGYRFDKNDLVGLHFSYGVNKHKDKK